MFFWGKSFKSGQESWDPLLTVFGKKGGSMLLSRYKKIGNGVAHLATPTIIRKKKGKHPKRGADLAKFERQLSGKKDFSDLVKEALNSKSSPFRKGTMQGTR